MNKFSKFVSALLPGFERVQVEEDIRLVKAGLMENTIPVYETAAEQFGIDEFKSKEAINFNKEMATELKRIDIRVKGTFVNAILEQLNNTVAVLTLLENDIDKYFGKDVVKSSLTYTQANIIKYIELASFNIKYARKILLWTLQKEQAQAGQDIDTPFTKAEVQWISDNKNLFVKSIRTLSVEPRKVTGLFKNIPNMVIATGDEAAVLDATAGKQVDPIGMGFIATKLNPIYYIGMAVAEYQALVYERSVEEKRSLEFRLLSLKEARSGKRDPKLEQQIEYIEGRVKKLGYQISRFEEE